MIGRELSIIKKSPLHRLLIILSLGFFLATLSGPLLLSADQGPDKVAFENLDSEFNFEITDGDPSELTIAFLFHRNDSQRPSHNSLSAKVSRVAQLLQSLSIDLRGPPALT